MHKFESHYIDNLVGNKIESPHIFSTYQFISSIMILFYYGSGNENAYFERSPINFVDKFSCPIILFQGLEDKVCLPNNIPFPPLLRFVIVCVFFSSMSQVVPPDQACKIYRALKEKGLPVALVEYEGEQHGFRKVLFSCKLLELQLAYLPFFSLIWTHKNNAQAENIKFTLEQQMVFFARLVGHFEVADDINPIKIENFDWSTVTLSSCL